MSWGFYYTQYSCLHFWRKFSLAVELRVGFSPQHFNNVLLSSGLCHLQHSYNCFPICSMPSSTSDWLKYLVFFFFFLAIWLWCPMCNFLYMYLVLMNFLLVFCTKFKSFNYFSNNYLSESLHTPVFTSSINILGELILSCVITSVCLIFKWFSLSVLHIK